MNNIMDDLDKYLIFGCSVSTLLFLLSEIIGKSRCKENSVFDFVVGGCPCVGGRDISVEITILEEEVRPLLN